MKFLLTALALMGVWVSILALRVHNQAPGDAPPCAVTEKFDCGAVNHSRFAVFPPRTFDEPANAKHIPIAILGIIGYSVMALAALFGRFWVLFHLAEIGFMMAAFLTYLEAYVLQKWCIYCLWSQAIVASLLVLTGLTLLVRSMRRPPSERFGRHVA